MFGVGSERALWGRDGFGIETVSGSIQFINNSGATVQVTVEFAAAISAMGSVTDPALESVSNVFYGVEFSESSGGDPNSPCTGGLFLDQQAYGLGAPPNTALGPLGTPAMRTASIPDGSTCSFNFLVQTGGRAAALPAVPLLTGPQLAFLALALLLVGVGVL